ncbi:hypothetical protein D3C72_1823330 [compost metagenome]
MFDRLEAGNRAAELMALGGVGQGQVQRLLSTTRLLGGQANGAYQQHITQQRPGLASFGEQLCRPDRHVLQHNPRQAAGLVEGR